MIIIEHWYFILKTQNVSCNNMQGYTVGKQLEGGIQYYNSFTVLQQTVTTDYKFLSVYLFNFVSIKL